MNSVKDEAYVSQKRDEVDKIMKEAKDLREKTLAIVYSKLQ